ncbi:MAG TPA: M13 family metallopeptidase [Casimicrobiaceae bacterium]|nr:M13 family metallopeptidase [Casimicrobiaceae bacterium]
MWRTSARVYDPLLGAALGIGVLIACSPAGGQTPAAASGSGPVSGIELQFMDASVRPQDDFYAYVNGRWLATVEIPADKGILTPFNMLDDATEVELKALIEGIGENPPDPDAQKIAALYASFFDEARLDSLGLQPIAKELARIGKIRSNRQLPSLIAHFNVVGVSAPYGLRIHQDAREPTRYVVDLAQSGLGLPDRDYYLKDDDKLRRVRAEYRAHIEAMEKLAGSRIAKKEADDIVALETELASAQWSRVENRNPAKTYNKRSTAELSKLMPAYDWNSYLLDAGVAGKIDYVIIGQPSYFTALGDLLQKTPLAVWKTYFRWRVLSAAAPYLGKAFADEHFAFYGTALRGIPQDKPRWKRGVELVSGSIGEALGKLYVARYFPSESKARMQALVRNLVAAYRGSIETLDWMSADTKKAAQDKLDRLAVKIGYPERWRDYSKLGISRDDLYGNVVRAHRFEYRRNVDKLGNLVDRSEWRMSPQTVNAYYNPELNEIVFPAAILQPPYFNAKADEAANYGGIGAVIGHEISHGFDDRGSQYDAEGKLRDWFTQEDHEKFRAKTRALVAQYDRYEPVPGFHVNGELTLGENIADNSGLAIAYKAYEISLGGKEAPTIDGLTGEQRFFAGWTQAWRAKVRDNEAIVRIKSDPHAPAAVRGYAPLLNQPGFYKAFGVEPGDKMYLPPGERITIW